MVVTIGDHNHIGCFADQVKLTHALVQDLDEAVKEAKLLGEHEEESSQKITELEVLCKRLMEDAHKLEEEKLITEIAKEIGLDRMGEDAEDIDEDADGNERGDAATSPVAVAPPLLLCHLLLPHLRRSLKRKTL
jgi:hypothetical protein